jgi:hypothetical protein
MRVLKLFLLFAVSVSVTMNLNAQRQKENSKTKKLAKDTLPLTSSLTNAIVDTSSVDKYVDITTNVFNQSKINFDTTDVPQDSFTLLIKKLLVTTKARETDLEAAEKALNESMETVLSNPETSEMTHKFVNQFMFEMREGRAANWMEKLYIRNYRALFTPEDVQALIDFYQTSAGQKSLDRTKILVQNVMSESRKIGAYLAA